MGDGHQRLDIVFLQLVKHIVVEFQAIFIWLHIISVRINPGPVDRHTEHFEAHLSHQRDVFFIVSVEINRLMARVIRSLFQNRCNAARCSVRSASHHIGCARSFAALIPAALELISSRCAAPKESVFHLHLCILLHVWSSSQPKCNIDTLTTFVMV
ncbi:hypothetical protein D3C75_957800 [compost metagenome]